MMPSSSLELLMLPWVGGGSAAAAGLSAAFSAGDTRSAGGRPCGEWREGRGGGGALTDHASHGGSLGE